MSKYTYEHLISTMNTVDVKSLINRMKIKTNAIVINQGNDVKYDEVVISNRNIRSFSFNERGVGLSRNSALERSAADICIVSDDDMVYEDDYLDIIRESYDQSPDADMILFNVRIHEDGEVKEKSSYSGKIHYLNSLKYGTVSFTFKRTAIKKNRIAFSLLFGGGALFSNGEDSLFLWDCLKAGLNIYADGRVIADVYNDDSSWFEGYNERYFMDRGSLFAALSSRFSTLLIYQYAIRKKHEYSDFFTIKEAFSLMMKGKNNYKQL